MYDKYVYEKIIRLAEEYKCNWGKEINLHIIASNFTQENFCKILERIVSTGENIIMENNKMRIG